MTLHPQCLAVVDLQAAIVNPVQHHRPFGHRIENRREVARRGSLLTPRWREMDSNHRYRIRNNPFWLPPFGPAIRLPQQKPALSCRGPMVRIHLPPAASHPSGLMSQRRGSAVSGHSATALTADPRRSPQNAKRRPQDGKRARALLIVIRI